MYKLFTISTNVSIEPFFLRRFPLDVQYVGNALGSIRHAPSGCGRRASAVLVTPARRGIRVALKLAA
jgi:hypothetical protein